MNLNMNESNEHTQKILDAVFDENISEILAEMESSPKKCEFLTEKFQLTPNDLDEKLSFLMLNAISDVTRCISSPVSISCLLFKNQIGKFAALGFSMIFSIDDICSALRLPTF